MVEFDCAVDHRAIPYIMKAKTHPATTRIMSLLEILLEYAFNLSFVKGKDMKIRDFLSRTVVDKGDSGDVIPKSFNSFVILSVIRKITLNTANKLMITTRENRIYAPNLPYYIRLYIISCHTCQLFKVSKKFDRPLMRRFYDISVPTKTNISMDIKYMPPSKSPYKYTLVLLCDISNFLVATPMKKVTAEEVCSILFDNLMAYFAVPMRTICDQDLAFMSSLFQWFFKAYGIQLVTVNPTNHKSLQAKHGIKMFVKTS